MGVGESSSLSPPPFVTKYLPHSRISFPSLFNSSIFPPFDVNNSDSTIKVIPQLDGNDSEISSDYGSAHDDDSISDENVENLTLPQNLLSLKFLQKVLLYFPMVINLCLIFLLLWP